MEEPELAARKTWGLTLASAIHQSQAREPNRSGFPVCKILATQKLVED
jgi:hypothetical protein